MATATETTAPTATEPSIPTDTPVATATPPVNIITPAAAPTETPGATVPAKTPDAPAPTATLQVNTVTPAPTSSACLPSGSTGATGNATPVAGTVTPGNGSGGTGTSTGTGAGTGKDCGPVTALPNTGTGPTGSSPYWIPLAAAFALVAAIAGAGVRRRRSAR
ncbi:MAG TPA: hypothetical protein VFQ54_13255 [Thermomicrobiales bacterium]|nr:hypothetical protein [Thermomicrobiales bacterium]